MPSHGDIRMSGGQRFVFFDGEWRPDPTQLTHFTSSSEDKAVPDAPGDGDRDFEPPKDEPQGAPGDPAADFGTDSTPSTTAAELSELIKTNQQETSVNKTDDTESLSTSKEMLAELRGMRELLQTLVEASEDSGGTF